MTALVCACACSDLSLILPYDNEYKFQHLKVGNHVALRTGKGTVMIN